MKPIRPLLFMGWVVEVTKKVNGPYEVISSERGFIVWVDECETRAEAIEQQQTRYALLLVKSPTADNVVREYRC